MIQASEADKIELRVMIDGLAPRREWLDGEMKIADCVSRLVQQHGTVPVDLTGRISAWYRAVQGGKKRLGSESVKDLDPGEVLVLARVRNRTVVATIEVQGLEDPIRFRAPVGTAIPVSWLVSHLREWLSLPDLSWTLSAKEEALLPLQILDELDPRDGLALVLSSRGT